MYTVPLLPYSFNNQLLYHQNLRHINEVLWPQNNWYKDNTIDLPPLPPSTSKRHRSRHESLGKRHRERKKLETSSGNNLDRRSESRDDSKETKKFSTNTSVQSRENDLAHENNSTKRNMPNDNQPFSMGTLSKATTKSKQLPPILPPSRSASVLCESIQRERKAHTMPPLFHIPGPRSTPKTRMFASITAPSDAYNASVRAGKESSKVLHSRPKSDVEMTDVVDETDGGDGNADDDDDAPIIITVRYDSTTGGPPSEDIVRQAVDNQLRQRGNLGLTNEPIIIDFLDKPVLQHLSRPVLPTQQGALRMSPIRPQQQLSRPVLPTQQQIPRMSPVRLQQQQFGRPLMPVQHHVPRIPLNRPQQLSSRPPFPNPQMINRPSIRIPVSPQRHQEAGLLPPKSHRSLGIFPPTQNSAMHRAQQTGSMRSTRPVLFPELLLQNPIQQDDYFGSIAAQQRHFNRDTKSAPRRTLSTEFKTTDNYSNTQVHNRFVPLKTNTRHRMATEQQLNTTASGRSGNVQRPHTAPSSGEMFRPPSAQEIPELSMQSILSMLNQIPDLSGRKFNIEYAPPTAPEGYPIPLESDANDGQYPEPIVVDQLPPNLAQHLSKSNNPAIAEFMRSEMAAIASSQPLPSTNVQLPSSVVMHHAAPPNQQVQQSRPASSSGTETSTERSSSESCSSEETDNEESEVVTSSSAKPSNNLAFTGPHSAQSH